MQVKTTRLSGSHSEGLDAGRGIAAVMVVIFHSLMVFEFEGGKDFYVYTLDSSESWIFVQNLMLALFNGSACVTFFFVLSGTVLSLSLERETRFRAGNMLGYLIKRGFRLYPLLILTAGLAALLQIYYFSPEIYPVTTTWFNASFKIAGSDVPQEFVANALGRSASLNGPAWSIKVELLASAVFPVLYFLSRSAGTAVATAIGLVMAMFMMPGRPEQYHYMHVFIPCFFAGALIPRWGRPLATWFYQSERAIRVLIILISALVLMLTRRVLAPSEFAPADVVLMETLCASVLIAVVLFGRDRAFYHSWGMRTLAEISYGVYLLHCIVLLVIGHAIMPMMPDLLGGPAALGSAFLLAAATLAITLPFAYALHRAFERPMQHIGRLIASLLARRAEDQRRSDAKAYL